MAGIESLVRDKMNVFRSNPARLEQSFQLNQQLLDLLALQKLKSEKEAAARDMQLQMAAQQGTPPTIKQQRETELLEHTRNEVAQQVGATGQQQAAEQQAMIQALMGGGGGQPQQGGIAGYAEGGSVDRGWKDPQLAGIRNSRSPIGSIVEWLKQREEEAERYRRTGSRKRPFVGPPVSEMRTPPFVADDVAEAVGSAEPAPMEEVDIDTIINAQPETTRARIQDTDTDTAPPRELPYEDEYSALLRSRLDPNFTRDRAAQERGIASEYLSTPPEVAARRKEYQDQLAALDAKQMDPKKLAQQRLAAFLITAGRGHNLASGLGIGGAAAANLRGEQEAAERSRLMERNKLADEYDTLEAQNRAAIYGAGNTAQTALENQVSATIGAVAQERRNAMDAEQRAADRAQEAALENSRQAAVRSLEEFKAGQGSKDQTVRLVIAAQANYDARLESIMGTARMLGIDPTPELEALEAQYEPIFEEAEALLGGIAQDAEGWTVRPK